MRKRKPTSRTQQIRVRSLAFPGLSTGVGGLDLQEAANAMVETVKKAIAAGTTIKRIILVGYDSDMTKAFEKALHTLQ